MYFIKPSGEYVFKNLSGALMDNRELSWTLYFLIILILECMKTAFENAPVLNFYELFFTSMQTGVPVVCVSLGYCFVWQQYV